MQNNASKNYKKWIVPAILAIFVIATIYLAFSLAGSEETVDKLKQENQEIQDYIAFEKEEMLSDLQSAKQQYDELKMSIDNDSLRYKLEIEQKRTQELLEALERTKNTDAAEIARLKKELKTLRGILESYIVQIDSLHRENTILKDENKTLIADKKEVEKERDNLAQEKEQLTEKVTLAAQLDATNVRMIMLNKKGKSTEKIKQAKQLQVSFTITKNITAAPGEKTAYARITDGDQELLTKNRRKTFTYEDREIAYSMVKAFEYTGEEQTITMYWDIEEKLNKGKYLVSIFVDGNMIGSGSAVFE
jgi:chromosome segregation ATPase